MILTVLQTLGRVGAGADWHGLSHLVRAQGAGCNPLCGKVPNVVGPFGLLQAFADAVKMLTKETIIPSGANRVLFVLAPMITFSLAMIAWAVIPDEQSLGDRRHQCGRAVPARDLVPWASTGF